MADGRLATVENPWQVASTHRCIGRIGDQAQDAKPDRVRKQLETVGEILRLVAADRYNENGFTTRGDEFHTDTIAFRIDIRLYE